MTSEAHVTYGRWVLRYGPNDYPGYIELIDGSFVPIGSATKKQLAESARLHEELARAYREYAKKLRAVARGEVVFAEQEA